MSLTQSAERAALNKLIDYLDDNPQENIDKIMDLVNKLVPRPRISRATRGVHQRHQEPRQLV